MRLDLRSIYLYKADSLAPASLVGGVYSCSFSIKRRHVEEVFRAGVALGDALMGPRAGAMIDE